MLNLQMNRRAFTIIELIVVITILAILGTIGLMNYTSYTVGARDMKRKSDLTLIDTALQKMITQGIAPNNFLSGTGNTGTGIGNFSLHGIDLFASGGTIYRAGEINIESLRDVGKGSIDPKTQKGYSLGVYNNNYEIAGTFEETNMAYILANYKKRTASGTIATLTGTIDTVNFSINLMNYSDVIKFFQGDIISTGGTLTYTIGAIQGTKIYLDGSPTMLPLVTDTIRLAHDETDIIGNAANGTNTGVVNCATASSAVIADIAGNLCPISDSTPNLVPYKVQ